MESRLRPLAHVLRARNKLEKHRLCTHPRVVSGFCEIAQNVIRGRVPLNTRQRRRWRRHKRQLRSLVSRRNSYRHKSRLLQTGGFLNLLLPVAKTLLGGLGIL